jgi:SAM-dependent methyltransferase
MGMGSSLYRLLKLLKSGTEDETNGRHIIQAEVCRAIKGDAPRILDVGAGYGFDLLKIARNTEPRSPQLYAVECFPSAIDALRKVNIAVSNLDIEHERLPFESGYFDVVICNQVLEHTKEIFWVVAELARVLKPDGTLILGVPNLGSLHNRVALLFWHQPPAVAVFGAHVRGFTIAGLSDFLERSNVLKIKTVMGGNFYPFPPKMSRPLCRLFPGFSVSSFYIIQRVGAGNFLDIFGTPEGAILVDTPYFRGHSKQPQS